MIRKTHVKTKVLCIAAMLCMTSTTVFTLSATPAFAERGGNGQGNGRSNDARGNQSERSNGASERQASGNNGRGHLARELGNLNAAHANPNALANASPNSMPGKLYTYKMSQEDFAAVVAIQDEKYEDLQNLIGLTEEEIEAAFPEGGYEEAVTAAAIAYEMAREDALDAQDAAKDSLAVLTDGRELSEAALAELWRVLGL
ncbi:hypothetical protein AN191_13825 [Loktanella sp. 5RATIMAR09]|uniref:hypothetical protein n=1 Tax=Loktanella sp. 5RATIMAR09 TaxID=1225655 RepID=UPI0006EB3F32|nr:hypothetical protein [Loktanella sp. 5RATIMAR09]KQI71352.1 hypothetical protein AN191_13825 [Loktanella sp. 5RATIMAR09]